MARQPSVDDAEDEFDDEDELDAEEELDDEEEGGERSAATDAFWGDVRVTPVEIALPKGVGFTLRAYRPATEVAAPEIERDDDEDDAYVDDLDEDELPEIDEEELTQLALAAPPEDDVPPLRRRRDEEDDEADTDASADEDEDEADDEADSDADDDDDDEDEDDEDDDDDDEDEEEEAEVEEVPVFLAHNGRLLLFATAEGLVEYVRTADEHDLVQLDTWASVRERIDVSDVIPLDEDRYELDLVVENLRGGHDAWNPMLIIQAGEIARDLGHALRIQPVITALSAGSPLDDLDEGLRGVETGGLGGFFARRRVRKIDAQTTAALGWRTIIGKISALVDWRN